jgi:para-nitrobenzyl esterase
MSNYFANFIKTGNPNGNKLPDWPVAKPDDQNPDLMVIDVESKAIKAKDDVRYLFHDKIYVLPAMLRDSED